MNAAAGALAAAAVAALLFVPAGAQTPEPFVIDAFVSTSGPNSFNGRYTQEALEVFEAYANRTGGIRGRPIAFHFADDQSSPQVAVQLLALAKARNPAIIVGSDAVATCGAMAPLVAQGPVMFCTSPGLDAPRGSYAFASTSSVKSLIEAVVHYFRARGIKRLALITATDAMGELSDRYVLEDVALPENRTLAMVAHERFNPAEITLGAQIARLKAANPDAIMAWATGPAFGNVLHALHDAGVDVPVATSGGNGNPAQIKQYASFLPTELLITGLPQDLAPEQLGASPIRRAIDEYRNAFAAAGKTPSPGTSPYVWDPAAIVLNALRALGTNATSAQVRDYIAKLHDFVGMNGIYDFRIGDQHGVTSSSLVVTRWDPAAGVFRPVTGLGGNPLR
jgi:branched-chain amino acid transport system substrate-binding protein